MILDILLIIILGPLGILIVIARHSGDTSKKSHPKDNKDWYLSLSLSTEDAMGQVYLLVGYLFLGTTLIAINRDFGSPLYWQTILFIFSIIGIAIAYYFKTIYSLFVALVALAVWWVARATLWIDFRWMNEPDIKSWYIILGLAFLCLLFYVVGHLHEKQEKYKRFALVYLLLGIYGISALLFFFSTKAGIETLQELAKGQTFVNSWQIGISLALLLISFLLAGVKALEQKLISSYEFLATVCLALLFIIAGLLGRDPLFIGSRYNFYSSYGPQLTGAGILLVILFNIAIFLVFLGLIFSGYARKETWLINTGALLISLLIVFKYFDWFFTFLDKSIFFVGAGLLLFALGWFMEKGRKGMIKSISGKVDNI